MKVASELGYGVTQMEEIILVTGCHLTRSWINVTFSKNQRGAQVSCEIRRSGGSGIDFERGDVNGGDVKFGPRGEVRFDMMLGFQPILRNHGPDTYRNTQNLSENQCILVRGFRVVPFLGFWSKLKAMAEPSDMPEPEPDRKLEPISVIDGAKVSTPGDPSPSYV